MTPQRKTTYRETNSDGQTEVRKAFSVERSEVKVWKEENDSGTEVTHIEVPVSSPSEDRDGDEFSEEGLEDMAAQFRSGEVGMWLDHGLSPETMFPDYRVLEQIGGWKDAEIREGGLFATGALRPSSDDASELEDILNEGVAPVGFSVGFIVEKSEEKSEDESGMVFHKTDLLECSAVGIPSNPDAMVSDSAMAAAKAVSNAGGYDGEPERLARAITEEMRSTFLPNEQRNQTMQSKQEDGELQAAIETIESYLDAEGTSADDPITEVIDWASEAEEEEDASVVENVAEEALAASDAGSLSDLPASEVMEWSKDQLETEESDGDEEEDEEEESSDPDKSDSDPPEVREVVRDALDEVLLDALTDEEALRSLISEEVREALSEEELAVEVTESFTEELRSELFKDTGDSREGPSPAGTISTYEPEEGSESEESGGKDGGSDDASKPSPAIGGN